MVHGQPNGPILKTLTKYLEIPNEYSSTLFRALAEWKEQPQLMRNEVGTLTTPALSHEELLEDLPQVEAALSDLTTNLGTSLDHVLRHYDRGTLKGLRHTSMILAGASGFKVPVPDDKLDEVKDLADALIECLTSDSTLESELKRMLYEHADAIRRSVDLYRVGGLDAVLGEFDRLMGFLNRRPELRVAVVKEPKLKKAVGGLLIAMNLLAAIGNAAVALESGVGSFLELTSATSVTETVAPAGVSVSAESHEGEQA
ncbi:hypothetical protein [Cryobacterium sp. AP23]